jgi:signal transduction histidine kinase
LREGRVGHFGLRGMRERASQIGAALTISSSPQNGTEVRLIVPGRKIFLASTKFGLSFPLRWFRSVRFRNRR